MNTKSLMTVTGPVLGASLGFCQSHEHLFIRKGRSFAVSPVLYMDDLEKSTQEARSYRASGGRTLVDAQPIGCGRMCRQLRQVSEATGVYILASTGFHKMCFYPEDHWIFSENEDTLTRLFICELQEGMFDLCDESEPRFQTDIKAGLIKAARDDGPFSVQYQKVFSAAVHAAIETGRALMVHIEPGSDPAALLRWLLDRGLPANQIIFCHTDRACEDPAIRVELASAGIYLELDTIGRPKYHSDLREAGFFKKLLDAGFERQLLFSLDTTRARMKSYTEGAVGLDYLLSHFVPLLKNCGVSERQIKLISHRNFVEAFFYRK